MRNILFFSWFISLLVLFGVWYFAFEQSLLHMLWVVDLSKLSFVILGLFFVTYIRLGVKLFQYSIKDVPVTEEDLEPGYEAAEVSMALGMLGTVIGFIAMTSSFSNIDFSNVENVKEIFELATVGMGTALWTTSIGLVSSITLRAAHYLTGWILKDEDA